MKIITIVMIAVLVLGVGLGIYYNLSKEEIQTTQDLVDNTPDSQIACVGEGIDIQDRNLVRCENGD